jgi:hypothetical protein
LAVSPDPILLRTKLRPIADQQAVHKLLSKLQSQGLEVVEFRRLPGEGSDPGSGSPSAHERLWADAEKLHLTPRIDAGQAVEQGEVAASN